MLRRLGVVIALATLAGCSSSVHGHGSLDAKLQCAGGAITASGAPFCYAKPDGFTDNSALTSYGAGWTYRTLISAGQFDLVEVLAARLPYDTDSYPDGKLRVYVIRLMAQPATAGATPTSGLTPIRVAGVRGYQLTQVGVGGSTARAILAYRGHTEVYIQCEQRDRVDVATAGCERVLGTIQIIDLH